MSKSLKYIPYAGGPYQIWTHNDFASTKTICLARIITQIENSMDCICRTKFCLTNGSVAVNIIMLRKSVIVKTSYSSNSRISLNHPYTIPILSLDNPYNR